MVVNLFGLWETWRKFIFIFQPKICCFILNTKGTFIDFIGSLSLAAPFFGKVVRMFSDSCRSHRIWLSGKKLGVIFAYKDDESCCFILYCVFLSQLPYPVPAFPSLVPGWLTEQPSQECSFECLLSWSGYLWVSFEPVKNSSPFSEGRSRRICWDTWGRDFC